MAKVSEDAKRSTLKEVRIRLAPGRSLYSDVPLSSPAAAMEVMRREMAQFDREVLCTVNLNRRLRPINFNIVSVGSLCGSPADIPNILKSGILSNAYGFLLLHNHPSGDVSPSAEDIRATKRCVEAGKLLGLPCLDHILIGGGNGTFLSLRESGLVDFHTDVSLPVSLQADGVGEGGTHYGKDVKGEKKMTEERKSPQAEPRTGRDEITIKFGRGLAQSFRAKSGKVFSWILIPNRDPADKTPWASFVLPENVVHENKYGKGLWAKIPAEGTTVISKPVVTGKDETGANIWTDEKIRVTNRELKALVEAYKERGLPPREDKPRESAVEKLNMPSPGSVAKAEREKPKLQTKTKAPQL